MTPTTFPKCLPAVPTPVREIEFLAEVQKLEPQLSPAALSVLLAHWGIETGRGKKCIAYNVGNIKAPTISQNHYCYFATYERLLTMHADRVVEASTEQAPAIKIQDFGSNFTLVLFRPSHPACRFRAYETLADGVADYLDFLKEKFGPAWEFVESGDPLMFAHKLKEKGYYTAEEGVYAKALKRLWGQYMSLIRQLQNGTSSSPSA